MYFKHVYGDMDQLQTTLGRRFIASLQFILLSCIAAFSLSTARAQPVDQDATSQPSKAKLPTTSAPSELTALLAAAGPTPFGDYRFELTDLRDPGGVAIGHNGYIYVADSGQHRIRVFDSNGKIVHGWGKRGSERGKLLFPRGIAIGLNGFVYVCDTGNHRVQVFRPDGKVMEAFGHFGSGESEFIAPVGLAVSATNIYVADTGNDRVQVFDLHGKWKQTIGSFGTEPGKFRRPLGVAVDPQGHVYVADSDNNRVQSFDMQGKPLKQWGTWGAFDGMLADPRGIAYEDERIYVTDANNNRVQVFKPDGTLLYAWGIHAFKPREGAGRFHYPDAVAISSDGKLAVVSEGFENRCQVFAPMPPGKPMPLNPFAGMNLSGASHYGPYIAFDEPLMALSEVETDQISLFNCSRESPILISVIGVHGDRAGQLIRPSGLALDVKKSRLYIADSGNRRLHVVRLKLNLQAEIIFEPTMSQFVAQLDFARLKEQDDRLKDRPIIEPTALKLDRKGHIYVLDSRQALVLVFDEDLKLQSLWGSDGGDKGSFRHPADLAISADGETVYVADSYNQRVQALTNEGKSLFAWGDHGATPTRLEEPFGIIIGNDNCAYVTDAAKNRVMKFDQKGHYMQGWGEIGVDDGQLFKPKSLAQRADSKLIIVDQGNHRGQVFSTQGEYISMFGSRFFTDKMYRHRAAPQKIERPKAKQ